MQKKGNIAVLMTCHNRRSKTLRCLNALFDSAQSEDYHLEVFLVDDGSTDGTGEAVNKEFPDVKVISGNGKLFWNQGMRLAWKTASETNQYNFYLWLNDDTYITKNAISVLLKDSESKDHQAIICGTCKSEITKKTTYGGYAKKNHKILIPNGIPQKCDYFNGNAVLIPNDVFNKVGNLDSVFHHSFGDYDYGLRALKLNIESFIASVNIGYCEKNDLPKWCNPQYPINKRLLAFYSPLGISPIENYIYKQRHWGNHKAITNLFSIHLRLCFPSLWTRKIRSDLNQDF